MGLASNVANLAGCPIPLGEVAQTIYSQMIKEHPDLARKDFSSVYEYLRRAMEEGKAVKPGIKLP